MKRRVLAIVLTMMMVVTLMPCMAFAGTNLAAPIISNLVVNDALGEGTTNLHYTLTLPQSVKDAIAAYDAEGAFQPLAIETWVNVNNQGWKTGYTANAADLDEGERSTNWDATYGPSEDYVQIKIKIEDRVGKYGDSDFSNVLKLNAKAYDASSWAEPFVDQAIEMGILPTCLEGEDMTQKITRLEFAALAVKTYEKMSGNKNTVPGAAFADCTDEEVLKAVAIGITNGTDTAKNLFSPNANITREQCAAMLARAYKATNFDGWTLGEDASYSAQFKASFTMPAKFADDSKISAYAKDSVYFMAANGIINGVGNNMFAPVADTTKGAAYGMATREAAIKIAVEMVKNL